MSEKNTLMKLNIGCGGKKLPGFINLDKYPHPHVDYLVDLEKCADVPLPFTDNTFDRMLMSHVFEHITNVLPMMEELWRIAKPGCKLAVITPYGSSDNADEDPTHVRRIFMDSYMYFSQAWYEENNYGYLGDWHYNSRLVLLNKDFFTDNATDQQVGYCLQHMRNIVVEFHAELIAVKPARKHPFEFDTPRTAFRFV